jgi:hypothetical protein
MMNWTQWLTTGAALMLMSFSGCLATGCGAGSPTMWQSDPNNVATQTPYDDQLLLAKRVAALGLKGELHLIGGDGHVLGFSYNIMGVNWTLDVFIDPSTGALKNWAVVAGDGTVVSVPTSDGMAPTLAEIQAAIADVQAADEQRRSQIGELQNQMTDFRLNTATTQPSPG